MFCVILSCFYYYTLLRSILPCEFNYLSIHYYCIILVVQYFSFLLFLQLFELFLPQLPFFLITFQINFSPSDNLYDTLLLSVLSNNIINMLTYYILIRTIEQLCTWLLFMVMWKSLWYFLTEAPEWKWRTRLMIDSVSPTWWNLIWWLLSYYDYDVISRWNMLA